MPSKFKVLLVFSIMRGISTLGFIISVKDYYKICRYYTKITTGKVVSKKFKDIRFKNVYSVRYCIDLTDCYLATNNQVLVGYDIGDNFTIRYDPDKPGRSVIDIGSETYEPPLKVFPFFIILSLLLFLRLYYPNARIWDKFDKQ
ncbi:hypothetical protein QNI19_14945 [Cytophagaceae bacterium DM2B3-1]|uniref:DUF3592 domain-containing protein n=1 Tax=Xanthocytophaga flava TaxID=3048013 RepID=A0ABT7CKH3_9BACT|nr:DUF3592 domain-containing protein [Xanthocytophaga flavus]MDJ1469728.1 hypothetical protein [Xanthocytophaga flavus]MDJ1494239.1 hypothetical protein [Xanthocytophaga flavus]